MRKLANDANMCHTFCFVLSPLKAQGKMKMLSIQNASFSIAGKTILEDISFQISQKQHIGLVGRNGSGKSTLFNLINDHFLIDSGKIEKENGIKILTIKQEIPNSNLSVLEYLLLQDEERSALFQELEYLENNSTNLQNDSTNAKNNFIHSKNNCDLKNETHNKIYNKNQSNAQTNANNSTQNISQQNNQENELQIPHNTTKIAHLNFSHHKLSTFCPNTRICEIYDRLLQIDAYAAESRAAIVLNGLGFDTQAQNTPVNSFSGGFKMRIALAAVLFQEPDLLLLDEPTNHLDLETTDWLEDFLKKYPKSFLLISHDRDFLNETIDYILHLKNAQITRYSGNFDQFLDIYNLKQKNTEAQNAKLESQRKHIMDFVNKFHAKATKAKQAQSRLKIIAKMKFLPIEPDDPTIAFNFPEPENLPPPILSFEKITLGYDDKIILKNVSGSIMPDDRIALVGNNGNGKTTFAKFLAGQLQQKKGTKTQANKLNIGFYMQNQLEQLPNNSTAYEHIQKCLTSANNQQIRTHLGNFGFSGQKADQVIQNLSGGERARLVFATLTINRPQLLILDEPTNHLDLEMRESLINSLTVYQGAVIIITHDKSFLKRVANTIYVVKDNAISVYNEDIDDYNTKIVQQINKRR